MFSAMANETIYWQTVEDNDDGDRYPDRRLGNLPGVINDGLGFDTDGVFLAQDEDNDGIPETNRNLNRIPDYDEPFLMYDVEPNAYAYGFDPQQQRRAGPARGRRRGGLSPTTTTSAATTSSGSGTSPGAGPWPRATTRRSRSPGTARNRSTYALLNYRRQGVEGLRRLFFENHFRRVRDDIADEYMVTDDDPGPADQQFRRPRQSSMKAAGGSISATDPPIYFNRFVSDLLRYQDSYVNETYLEGRLNPWSTFNLVQKFRVRLNWQQGGRLHSGLYQQRRRLDYWTWVSRAEYTLTWDKLSAMPQFKFMLLRLSDRERDLELQDEIRSIPILRTALCAPQPHRAADGIAGLGSASLPAQGQGGQSLQLRAAHCFRDLDQPFALFGYDLTTIVGISRGRGGLRRGLPALQGVRFLVLLRAGGGGVHRVRQGDLGLCSRGRLKVPHRCIAVNFRQAVIPGLRQDDREGHVPFPA